jgi:RNA polymerase sigma-70 factor, ECF subfamily
MTPDTEQLVRRAAAGEPEAREELLARHRARLRQMVGVHLDRRLLARLDPSDVVQEVLVEAHRKLDGYLRRRPLPFYPWLRQLAWERLVKLHQRHHAQRRRVTREEPLGLPEESALHLAERLLAPGGNPSHNLIREEVRRRVRDALARLGERDREVLVLRYLEQLSTRETAEVLGLSEGAVKTRLVRALARLQTLLSTDIAEEQR